MYAETFFVILHTQYISFHPQILIKFFFKASIIFSLLYEMIPRFRQMMEGYRRYEASHKVNYIKKAAYGPLETGLMTIPINESQVITEAKAMVMDMKKLETFDRPSS